MSILDVTFGDAEHAVIDRLMSMMAEPVSTWFPKSSTESPPVLPFVQVGWDGTPGDRYPVAEDAEVRVTYWAASGRYSAAKAGAATARGHLLAHPGDGDVWCIRPGMGRLPGVDPDTNLPFCTFTVKVSLRPAVVA